MAIYNFRWMNFWTQKTKKIDTSFKILFPQLYFCTSVNFIVDFFTHSLPAAREQLKKVITLKVSQIENHFLIPFYLGPDPKIFQSIKTH